jgi:hypothetical protein
MKSYAMPREAIELLKEEEIAPPKKENVEHKRHPDS